MNVRYRIRLLGERVIGPFTAEEIGELYLKKHIKGDEVCQLFPIGDWKSIRLFPNLLAIIAKIERENISDVVGQIVKKEGSLNTRPGFTMSDIKTFKEFKFERNHNNDIDYEELEKIHREKFSPEERENVKDSEKTQRIMRGKAKAPLEINKTIIIPEKAMLPKKKFFEASKTDITEKYQTLDTSPEGKKEELAPVRTKEELQSDKTEFVNLASVLPTINAQLSVSEVELDNLAKIEENNEKIRLRVQREKEDEENNEEDDIDEEEENDKINGEKTTNKKRKKGMSIIVAFTFFVLAYFLLEPEEKPKITGPLYFEMTFPIVQEFSDSDGASAALVRGRALYVQNLYTKKAAAAELFALSLQKQFKNNEALGELILTGTELLEDTKDVQSTKGTIHRLIQTAENKMLSDLNVATGTALFFEKMGKYQTGINVIKTYLRAKGAVSAKLLSYYLNLLIDAGDLVEARKTYTKLKDVPRKPIEAYVALARFSEIDDQPRDGKNIIEEGVKNYPQSTLLLLRYADYLFLEKSSQKYEEILFKVNKTNAENSPALTAKFYYHMGILSALKKKTAEATQFFKRSLAIKESDELRAMLSSLEIGGDKFSQALIVESKVVELMKKSKAALREDNLEAAFSYAIEAVDISPDSIPAILLLVKLQLRRGLFDSAINTLQGTMFKNPTNNMLKKTLVSTLISARKFEEAQKILAEIAQTKFSFSWEYASLMGDFYLARGGNGVLAIRWYVEALARDPLSDYDMFQLAKFFLKAKKFNDAKLKLSKALLLDPQNPEYLAAYSEILFEQDNTDTAIGYLRDTISEIGENHKLLAAIAKLYYKSGQLKEFQTYYKKIQSLPKKDEAFYEFLIYASEVEQNIDDYIKYSRELLKLNPGNLRVRLDLGEHLYNLKRYQEASEEFEEVRSKLAAYPKVHYMLAKIYLAMGDIKSAKKAAQKEVDLNPGLDTSYFIAGEVARIENDYREAVVKYEKAISLNPKAIDALMAMGWIRLAQNYASEAVELYARALREDKTNAEAYRQLGLSYKAAGQRALAKEKFEDYLKINPGAPDKEQIEMQIRALE